MPEIPKYTERQKARLEPQKIRDVRHLEEFLGRFTRDVILQPSMEYVCLRIDEANDPGRIRLTGWVAYPSQVQALKTLLADAPLCEKVDVLVSVLPQEAWSARVFFPCPVETIGRQEPSEESSVVHIWAERDPIQPLLKQSGWLLCRMENGYLAWIESPGADFFTQPCRAPDPSEPLPDLFDEDFLHRYLDTRYVWGGMSEQGIDCSGFTFRIFQEAGLILPRDSCQQMLLGSYLDPMAESVSFQQGDLLFFTHEDGRIGHVACSLGGHRVIHAEEPILTTFSLYPDDPDYNPYRAEHLAFGKRILVPR